ncbi:TPA: glycosyltransferase [Candidatus Sumerlaeota bacterium]|jgi:polyisoprenyl-phosphate glycosyltransferase|nr:glycosyltransferase [Candidatus Sumerlaeota bacterium]
MLPSVPISPLTFSVVVPCYRCAECLPELYRRIKESLEPISPRFELILVNDSSPSNDWLVIRQLAAEDTRVKGVNLSRNFGQHHAITAGVDQALGEWVVVMDGDLQDQPEEIVKLYQKAQEGFDVVFAVRENRQDSWHKRLSSQAFYWVYNRFSNIQVTPGIANFSICSRQVMDEFRQLRESSRAYWLGVLWCGFRVAYLPVEHAARYAGRSAYNLRRSMNLALESISSQSNKPLRIFMELGFLIATGSFLFTLFLVVRYFVYNVHVEGWTSTLVSLYFLGGLVMMNLGIVGLYLGKVFDETKGRPIYIVREKLNIADSSQKRES